MSRVGGVEHNLPMGQDVGGVAVVDHGGGHQAEPGMMMLVVVPLKKGLAETASVFDRTKTFREARPIFQGAELTFRIGIVIGNVRTAVGFDDALEMMRKAIFSGDEIPKIDHVSDDIDVFTLDAGHVLPNMSSSVSRGIWFSTGSSLSHRVT